MLSKERKPDPAAGSQDVRLRMETTVRTKEKKRRKEIIDVIDVVEGSNGRVAVAPNPCLFGTYGGVPYYQASMNLRCHYN